MNPEKLEGIKQFASRVKTKHSDFKTLGAGLSISINGTETSLY